MLTVKITACAALVFLCYFPMSLCSSWATYLNESGQAPLLNNWWNHCSFPSLSAEHFSRLWQVVWRPACRWANVSSWEGSARWRDGTLLWCSSLRTFLWLGIEFVNVGLPKQAPGILLVRLARCCWIWSRHTCGGCNRILHLASVWLYVFKIISTLSTMLFAFETAALRQIGTMRTNTQRCSW